MHLRETKITVAGHLEERRGHYHMLFSWKEADGKRKRASKTTGLPVERNYELAMAMLEEHRLAMEAEFEAQGKLKLEAVRKDAKNDKLLSGSYDPRVTGHIELSKGIFRMRIRWINPDGSKGRKMISTELPDKRGNRRRADGILDATCEELENELRALAEEQARKEAEAKKKDSGDALFADFLDTWLRYKATDKSRGKKIAETTLDGYDNVVRSTVGPYFRAKKTTVRDMTVEGVTEFYDFRAETVKGTTILHDHAVITGALKYAGELRMVEKHLYREIPRPTKEAFEAAFLRESEVIEVCKALDGHYLKLGFILGAYYGLRRSEAVGLRWRSIDLEANTITIEHTVVMIKVNGVKMAIRRDRTKSKSSRRTLPLIPIFKEMLVKIQEEQRYYREICGNCYNNKDSAYVYTDPLGNLISPDKLTREFPKFLEKNGFRRVRFHDLRHSCASLLLANGVSLKEVQEWLGHSDFSITANIYGHLDYESKVRIANTIGWMNEAEGKPKAEPSTKGPKPTMIGRRVRVKVKKTPKNVPNDCPTTPDSLPTTLPTWTNTNSKGEDFTGLKH